ncbi:hypothetical protein FHG87_004322 [Trinorchestia longiramus]|nr:hypothetical protein FHG87_004322 [Trinorchestia longiramus]
MEQDGVSGQRAQEEQDGDLVYEHRWGKTMYLGYEHRCMEQDGVSGLRAQVRGARRCIWAMSTVLISNKHAEECYMIPKEKIATVTEHHIPRNRIRSTNNPPWFSQEIKRLINARQQSYRSLKRYQTELHRQEHIQACRAVKGTVTLSLLVNAL